MSTWHFLVNSISRLTTDRGGNFAMVTALLIPVLVGSAGVALDFSNMVSQQRQLQDASDAAALAAATALMDGSITTSAQAETLAKEFVAGQMANSMSAADTAALKTAPPSRSP